MVSTKERMRDGFYMEMWDKHGLEKDQVIEILRDAGIDLSTFEIPKLKLYEKTVEKHIVKQRIKKNLQPFPRSVCPYPGCEGEKISYTRSGRALWFCSEGGDSHRIIWRTGKLKALMDLKEGLIGEAEVGDKITEFIKEYERYVEQKENETEKPSDQAG